jgi:hypothetical protein
MEEKMEITTLKNGIKVVTTSPHGFVFDDGTVVPKAKVTLNAEFVTEDANVERLKEMAGLQFIVSKKKPTKEGKAFLLCVPRGVLVIGSMIAAEAYGFPVAATVPTKETETLRASVRRANRKMTEEEIASQRVKSETFVVFD